MIDYGHVLLFSWAMGLLCTMGTDIDLNPSYWERFFLSFGAGVLFFVFLCGFYHLISLVW